MVVNKLQNGVLNSRKTQSASRLNCQNIFFKYGHILFLIILIEMFILKTTMYDMCNLIRKKFKKISLHFETNDEHEKLSKFIALQCNKLTKLS
jgi:fucose permease